MTTAFAFSRRTVLAGAAVLGTCLAPLRARAGVNANALAALRPGAPVADVQAAFGEAWRPLAAHKGGVIDRLENTHGFRARIDAAGAIGDVRYLGRFNREAALDGIRIGMSFEDVRRARPGLRFGPETKGGPPTRIGTARLAGGTILTVEIRNGEVHEIAYRNPKAAYPPMGPPPYPEASGAPGAPFADPNFKLVVLSALLDGKEIDLGRPEELAAYVLGRPIDPRRGGDLIPEVRDYLARYPLTTENLAWVEELRFDGGNAVYAYVWPSWDGESEEFDVASLAGIERLSNLERLIIGAMASAVDLRPLKGLPKLKALQVDVDVHGVEALLEMPALKTCRLSSHRLLLDVLTRTHPSRRALDALKDRGVRVRVSG